MIGVALISQGQDTLRIFHYNLLYYGINVSGCTSTNNNIDLKDQHLAVIINHIRPDIFTVNELGRGPAANPQANATRILNNVLNTQGRNHFSAAAFTNIRGSDIVNMLYYNHHKFTLHSQDVITSITRDINLYRLYINDRVRLAAGDTTFLIAIVAHFKAGSTSDDLSRRADEAAAVMSYIQTRNLRGNIMFLADFNMKNAFEQAFQTLTQFPTAMFRFHDPIEVPGDWFNNLNVALYHTQSTRSQSNGCFIGGGMDDRFDKILLSRSLMLGDQGLLYQRDSYIAVGQDGIRLNGDLNVPTNNSAPASVINALFNMSDHLPVGLNLITRPRALNVDAQQLPIPELAITNPIGDYLSINSQMHFAKAKLSIYSLQGNLLWALDDVSLQIGENRFTQIAHFKPGLYILRVEIPGMAASSFRIVKF